MGRVSKAREYLSRDEILEKIKETEGFWRVQRWFVILHATVDPRTAREIAIHTGLAEQTVHNLIARYNRYGPHTLEGQGKGGRRRSYMTWEEEEQFFAEFTERALRGELTTVYEIKGAFERRIGKRVHKTTIYRMLDRHEWRKLAPRPTHINAEKGKQEEFKKNVSS